MSLMKKLKKVAIGLAIARLSLVLLPLYGQTTDGSTLTVRVTGARDATGVIRFALFNSADGFPQDASKVYQRAEAQINPQTLTAQAVFTNLPPGTYAVAVFHDENMSGKLQKNFMGVPKEGHGASNNPKKRMGPPSFEESQFSLSGTPQAIEITLIH